MPRDRNIARALARQSDPSLPPSLELRPGDCPILAPSVPMRIRLEKHEAPLPECPRQAACPVRQFFAAAAASKAEVELDIGAGYGRFSRGRASGNPQKRILALEQEAARVARSDVAARTAGLKNLALLRCEMRWALEYCVPPESVSRAFVLFPDPWPKDRHARNRFFRPENIALVRRALVPGGVLDAATDNEAYFGQMLETMAAAAGFERTDPCERSEKEKTDFELKFAAQGKRMFSAAWRKIAPALVAAFALAAVSRPMPSHAITAEWTGAGASASWNDAGNWRGGAVPVPSPGLSLFFGAGTGAAFGFKGDLPFRSIELAFGASNVSIRAPTVQIGASVNRNPDDGWIVEEDPVEAFIRNGADATIALDAKIVLHRNLRLDTAKTNGVVLFSAGAEKTGKTLVKSGPGTLVLSGDGVFPPLRDFDNGRIELRSGNWDFAGADVQIGRYGAAVDCVATFGFGSGSASSEIGIITVSGKHGGHDVTRSNRLVLGGGRIAPVGSLVLGRNAVLEVAIDSAATPGTGPLRVSGNADFGSGAFVLPAEHGRVRPGVYPVLAWKGNRLGQLSQLRLHPDADTSLWELVIDEKGKKIGLRRKK